MTELAAAFLAKLQSALTNQVVSGGLVLMLTGALLALARNVPLRIIAFVRSQFTVTLDVMSTDELFSWLLVWLDEHPYSKKARRITAKSLRDGGDNRVVPASRYSSASGQVQQEKPRILFTPAHGRHLFWINGVPVWMSRDRKETEDKSGWAQFRETITITMLGRSQKAARTLLEVARDLACKEEQRTTGVYGLRFGDWYRIHETPPRSTSSIVLPEGVMEGILADAERFLAAEAWYRDRGIPWRRGYLLEGAPGSGKSSTTAALAGHLGMNLYLCNVAQTGMDDEKLVDSLLGVPERAIVLLEDIDAVASDREITDKSRVTFAGLLNALDGVASRQGIITVMTTNHADTLDPALIRHGRVDRRITYAAATEEQAARFFQAFYGRDEGAAEFGRAGAGRCIAELQGICLEHRENPAEAVAAVRPVHLEKAAS